MGTPRHEELRTADLAGQPPTSAEGSDAADEAADVAHDDRTDAAARTGDDVAVTTARANQPRPGAAHQT